MTTSSKLYAGVDLLKLICALLIVFMHTYNHDGGTIGEWVYSYTATEDSTHFRWTDNDYFYHKNDKIELIYKLNEGGTAEQTTCNLSRDRSSTSGGGTLAGQ